MFKMTVLYSIVLFSIVLNGISAKVAPAYIKTCPGLKPDCLKRVVQETLPEFSKGIPELGVESIDPLRQEMIKMVLPGGFKVEMHNGTMTGLRKCNIESVTYENFDANLKMRCDINIKGKYKAHGRILIVSINGDGDAKIKIKNALLEADIKFNDKVRDGITYREVKSIKIKQNFGEKVTFGLTNLFQGNPELSEAVLLFLNQNWKQISDEFGGPLVDKLVDIVYNIIKRFFEAVPRDELFV